MRWSGVGSVEIGMFRNFLDECFTYDALSGELNWKMRPVHHFQSEAKCRFIVTGDASSKHLGTFSSLFEAACVRKSWELENGYTPDYGGLSGIKS